MSYLLDQNEPTPEQCQVQEYSVHQQHHQYAHNGSSNVSPIGCWVCITKRFHERRCTRIRKLVWLPRSKCCYWFHQRQRCDSSANPGRKSKNTTRHRNATSEYSMSRLLFHIMLLEIIIAWWCFLCATVSQSSGTHPVLEIQYLYPHTSTNIIIYIRCWAFISGSFSTRFDSIPQGRWTSHTLGQPGAHFSSTPKVSYNPFLFFRLFDLPARNRSGRSFVGLQIEQHSRLQTGWLSTDFSQIHRVKAMQWPIERPGCLRRHRDGLKRQRIMEEPQVPWHSAPTLQSWRLVDKAGTPSCLIARVRVLSRSSNTESILQQSEQVPTMANWVLDWDRHHPIPTSVRIN